MLNKTEKNHIRHSLLTGELPYRMERDDRCPVDPIFRAFRMESEDSNSIIVKEFIPLILDPEVKIRAAALWFFENFSKTDDQGHLSQAYAHHLNLFEGIQDPWPGRTYDLRTVLAKTLASRILNAQINDPSLQETIWTRELYRPNCGQAILMSCLKMNEDQVRKEAQEIIQKSPQALANFLWFHQKREEHHPELLELLKKLKSSWDSADLKKIIQSNLIDPFRAEVLNQLN